MNSKHIKRSIPLAHRALEASAFENAGKSHPGQLERVGSEKLVDESARRLPGLH